MDTMTTAAARIWRRDDGVIVIVPHPGSEQTLADAQEIIAAVTTLGRGGPPLPILVDVRHVKSQTRDARNYYSGPKTRKVARAVALVIGNPLSRMLANAYLGISKPPITTRLVEDEETGLAWLRQFLPTDRR